MYYVLCTMCILYNNAYRVSNVSCASDCQTFGRHACFKIMKHAQQLWYIYNFSKRLIKGHHVNFCDFQQ